MLTILVRRMDGSNDGSRNFVWGVIKKFKFKKKIIKRELKYIELSTKKKFTISFYKFSNFELLYDSHYEYLLPMWVAMTILLC